jgi:hypothetical protein
MGCRLCVNNPASMAVAVGVKHNQHVGLPIGSIDKVECGINFSCVWASMLKDKWDEKKLYQ